MKSFKLLLLSFAFAVVGLFGVTENALAVPEGCELADLKFYNDGGSASEITYTGNTVSSTCVLTGNRGEEEGSLFHTGILSEDQVFNGSENCSYTITGLGTTSVTVTSNSEQCRPLHLDLFFGEPEPQVDIAMSLGMIGPSCGGNGFDVTATLTDNGSPLANYAVTFTYKGNVVPASTDANGLAKVSFGYQGDDGVTVEATGVDAQVAWAAFPNGCPGGGGGGGTSVLGASTGEVLGVTTLAAASGLDYKAMIALYVLGSGLVLTGLVKYAFQESK